MDLRTLLVYAVIAIGLGVLGIVLWANLHSRVRRLETEVRRMIIELSKLEKS